MTITVSANNARVRYTATSSQTAFAVPFEFTDNDEISVFVATTATNEAGAEKTQGTGSTHYAISGGGGATGTVTFVTGITQGHIVTIVRDIPVERTTDFTAGTTINRAALNTQLDNMTAMIGDLKDRTDRSIRLSDSDTENSLLLPSIDNRAGKIFGFNSSGGLTADTAANFDISLDDVLSNTITIAGNTNSKFLVSTALDSHLKSVGGVLNLQSQKGSNTAGISLDGSASVGIDISAGNKTIRIQDATNFTSTVDIDGALNVDGAAIIDGTLGAGASTLSSIITNTITSLASGDIDIKPLGGQVNILGTGGEQRILFDSGVSSPTIDYFQNSNITKLGIVNPTASRTILLPNASDTLVGKATTDTLTNKTLTSPVLNTGVSGSAFLDEDNMASNSATKVASQQSIKAYVDSVAGGATLSALLSSGNTTGGTDIAVSANDDITFTDSSKAIFGAGGDLKIHHDASNSYITESGTGGLYIESSTVRINTGTLFVNNAANDESLFKAVQNFGVTLYYNNEIKIATTNTGIAVTGEVAATTLDISGAIDVAGTTNLDVVDIDGAVDMATTLAVAGNVDFNGDLDVDGTTNLDVVDIDGAVNMATTALVTGVLTTTAATVFNGGFASNAGSTITENSGAALEIISTDTGAGGGPRIDWYRNPGQAGTDSDNLAQLNFFGLNDASEKSQYLYLFAEMADVANGSEDVRFGFGGLVAGADSSLMTFTYETQATGADPEMVFNDSSKDINFRVESNGNANMLFVDGGLNKVGIGVVPVQGVLTIKSGGNTYATGNLVLEDTDSTSRTYITHVNGDLAITNNTSRDDLILDSSGNFKVATGNLVIGTAGKGIDFSTQTPASGITPSSEILDHYEEGVGTAGVTGSSGGTATTTGFLAYYTKIGRVVHYQFECRVTNVSGVSGALRVALPFSAVDYSAGALRCYNATFDGSPFFETVAGQSYGYLYCSKTGATTQPILSTGYYYGSVSYVA